MNKDRFDQAFNNELGGMGVRIAQDPDEFWQVIKRLNILKPKRILEIGVQYGGTSLFWNLIAKELVIGVDCDLSGVVVDLTRGFHYEFISGDSTDINTITSVEKFAPYDFLWIDGGHTYEIAKSDWDNYSPMIRPGGLIGVHDVKAQGTGPEILIRELEEAGFNCELFIGHKGTALVHL